MSNHSSTANTPGGGAASPDRPLIAVLDDWQGIARSAADWSALESRANLTFFNKPFDNEAHAAEALRSFDIILAMRERTPFPMTLTSRLPKLKMFALTGHRGGLLDLAGMVNKGITVCYTDAGPGAESTAELTLGLMLAAARDIPNGDRSVRSGSFQQGTRAGMLLSGRTLGIAGLGTIGKRMAGFGRALGMDVQAWSQNLTAETAACVGARLVTKDELIKTSDVITLHLVLSERTRHTIGEAEFAAMKTGAILVNTSRAGLVDETALGKAVRERKVIAALDVFHVEPYTKDTSGLLVNHENTVLTPHLGYGTADVFKVFYAQLVENAVSFLDGRPSRPISDAPGAKK